MAKMKQMMETFNSKEGAKDDQIKEIRR